VWEIGKEKALFRQLCGAELPQDREGGTGHNCRDQKNKGGGQESGVEGNEQNADKTEDGEKKSKIIPEKLKGTSWTREEEKGRD